MAVVLVLEQRFERTPDGRIWGPGPFLETLWPRYVSAFGELRVAARMREVAFVPSDWHPAEGKDVSFAAIPDYVGPEEYLFRSRAVAAALRSAVCPRDSVILRVPSQLASVLTPHLITRGHPFAVEVVGDPFDVFSRGAIRHPLRPLLRWLFVARLRRQCREAITALYVTESALQRRYPCPNPSVAVSDVVLHAEHFVHSPRQSSAGQQAFRLAIVGTLAQLYKAPDVLLGAVAKCAEDGLDLHVTFVGDGAQRPWLERKAARLGIAARSTFVGHLSRPEDVRQMLDNADLFVLPSRQEGLPRALVEAMARALPCIGSRVGGIPELLAEEDLVPTNDVRALARKITEVLGDPERRERMSARNLMSARRFAGDTLDGRRAEWFAFVKSRTEALLRARAGAHVLLEDRA